MAIQVEQLKGEAIIVYHYPEKLETNKEIRDALIVENDIAQAMPDPVIWVIHNTSRLNINFGRLVTALEYWCCPPGLLERLILRAVP